MPQVCLQAIPADRSREPDDLIQGWRLPADSKDTTRMMDPIHQFNIEKIFTIGRIGGQEIAFTNSSAYMFASVAVISLLMLGAGRKLVPGRFQSTR